jgi:phosphoribosylformylglycinamidine synthase
MKSMAAIANTARQLACAGIRPEVCSGFVTIPDSNQSEKGSFLKGIKDAAQILNLDIKYLSIESGLGLPKGTFCTAGTAIKEGLFPNTFPESDLFISMLGSHRGELGGSHYLSLLNQENAGNRPVVDLMMESRLQDTILTGIQGELIQSARPIGRGGLAVSIAKSLANNKNMGTRVHFSRKLKTEELLFGETQGLVLVTINESDLMEFERVCMTIGIPATTIGRVTNDGIYSFNDSIKVKVEDLN